jgi:hypothetical protein
VIDVLPNMRGPARHGDDGEARESDLLLPGEEIDPSNTHAESARQPLNGVSESTARMMHVGVTRHGARTGDMGSSGGSCDEPPRI